MRYMTAAVLKPRVEVGNQSRRTPFSNTLLLLGALASTAGGCGFNRVKIRGSEAGTDAGTADVPVVDVLIRDTPQQDACNSFMCMTPLVSTVAPLGLDSAPVKIYLFQSLQGPFDAMLALNTLPSIRTGYVDTGKTKLLHIDFPLEDIFANALDTAVAARAANVLGKFWEMRNLLYQRQSEWINLRMPELRSTLIEYAASLGMDRTAFANELDNRTHSDAVLADKQKAIDCGFNGVPTVILMIPKDRVSENQLRDAVAAPQLAFSAQIKDAGSDFAVIIVGAFSYDAYQSVLDTVRY